VRGCLSFLVFLAVLLGLAAWFAVPPATDWIVTQIVRGSIAGDVHARVTTNPPPRILLLHADTLRIDGTAVTLPGGTIHAATLSLTLTDVNLLDRRAAAVTGRLDGVTIAGAGIGGGVLVISSVSIAGPPDALSATVTIDSSTALAVASADVAQLTGSSAASVSLVAPDVLRIGIQGRTLDATLLIRGGSLVADPPAGTIGPVTIVDGSLLAPLHLTGVQVTASAVILTGRLDRSALGF